MMISVATALPQDHAANVCVSQLMLKSRAIQKITAEFMNQKRAPYLRMTLLRKAKIEALLCKFMNIVPGVATVDTVHIP